MRGVVLQGSVRVAVLGRYTPQALARPLGRTGVGTRNASLLGRSTDEVTRHLTAKYDG
jgi:hypothetical protein